MNYIRHLTGFYEKVQQDQRLNPTHISLYLALFQFWNLNFFRNPVSISRNDVMNFSKIQSYKTYHKCINELMEFGYIEYLPSYNPYKGSMVNLFHFENFGQENFETNNSYKQSVGGVEHTTKCTSNKQLIPSSINIKKTIIPNNKQMNSNITELDFSTPWVALESSTSDETCRPPQLSDVKKYFKEKEATEEEALKFFNYFESNGWLVGGKTKMKNWQAACRNWLLNSKKYKTSQKSQSILKSSPKSNNLHAATSKNYRDPL